MTITFENEYAEDLDARLGFSGEALAREVIAKVLSDEDCPYEAEISVLFIDEDGIREINSKTRGIDAPTDVLSFPMFPFSSPAAYGELEEAAAADTFDPESGELLLGDIVLCIPRVFSQALEYGHSVRREYAFLLAHSVLHLLGYDHMSAEEAAEMEKRQERSLKALGISREPAPGSSLIQ